MCCDSSKRPLVTEATWKQLGLNQRNTIRWVAPTPEQAVWLKSMLAPQHEMDPVQDVCRRCGQTRYDIEKGGRYLGCVERKPPKEAKLYGNYDIE